MNKKFTYFGLVILGSIILLLSKCNHLKSNQENKLNYFSKAKYVGINVCSSCHQEQATTFSRTGMGQSFHYATKRKSVAKFGIEHQIYDSTNNMYYYPFWKDSILYIAEYRLNHKDTIHYREERIDYIIGSGQHTNSHLIKKGDYLVQAPLTWYAQKGKWDLPPGFDKGNNSRFSRVIDIECMSCHNALPTLVNSSTRQFITIPHGINCERCHGPGSMHVQNMKKGVFDNKFIVNPAKLSLNRQIDVCQRCHLQGNNVLKEGKSFADFIPGMTLSDIFEIYLPEYEGDESLFNMANHSERFQLSACYKSTLRSKKSFTCISCHNPHISVNETKATLFNSICNNCHTRQTILCSENTAVLKNAENNCVKCHMPKSGTEDIPHVRVHDHKISIPNTNNTTNNGTIIGLRAVNNKNPETITLIEAYLTYYEKFDANKLYQKKAAELLKISPNIELQIHLFYQLQNWASIVKLSSNLEKLTDIKALSSYRMAKAYVALKDYKNAAKWMELAVFKAPDRFEYKSELAANFIKINKYALAKEWLTKSLAQYDTYLPTLNNMAYLHIVAGEFEKANKNFSLIKRLNPDYIPALENQALLYQITKDDKNLIITLEKILDLDPLHIKAKSILNGL